MAKQEIRILSEVNLREFNRMRSLLTDKEDNYLEEDITTDALDASGRFEQRDVHGNKIIIHYLYNRED